MIRLFHRPFIRGIEGDNLLEIFFVTAISSVLGIRFFLAITGYPQLSGRGLHIAHVLLGGLFMMIALIITLAYINKSASYLAAVLGGFGFGAFIDELGKFITGDNNYFFQPTIALIYITFVLTYLAVEAFIRRPELSERERLINALEITKEVALSDLDHKERECALKLLNACNSANPVVESLKNLLQAIDCVPVPEPDIYEMAKSHALSLYGRLVQKRWFINSVIAFFVLQSIAVLVIDSALVYIKLYWSDHLPPAIPVLSFTDLAGLTSATLAAVMVIAGISRIHSNRLVAYQFFRNGILIQIFLVQVFLFYKEQLTALLGLVVNILVLLVLHYMIRQESAASGTCTR